MADPKSNTTPATAIDVAGEDDIMILSDDPVDSLTVDDLPTGVLKDANKQAATQIIEIFKEKAPSMPREVRDKILSLLKEGIFHHNTSSLTEPSYHPLAEKMWDKQVRGPFWLSITYEYWFILVGIYGLERLERSAVGAGIRSSIERRYGGDIGTDLTWRNHPVDQGLHARHLLTELAVKVSECQKTVDQLQRTADQQQKTIQKLADQQQGLTGHDQRASQIAEDDDPMETFAGYDEDEGEDDDEMEKLTRRYLFGEEDEDDDPMETFAGYDEDEGEDDDEMEKLTRRYLFGEEDEDDDPMETFAGYDEDEGEDDEDEDEKDNWATQYEDDDEEGNPFAFE